MEQTVSFEQVEQILKKESLYRTEREIYKVFIFLSQFQTFKDMNSRYGQDIINNMIKLMRLKFPRKNQYVIDYGTEAETCYLVLQGCLEVFVPIIQKYQANKNLEFFHATLVKAGSLVGDKSLLDRKLRTASVKCITQDTILGEINRKEYLSLFEKEKRCEMTEELNFYLSVSVLKTFPLNVLEKIFYIFEKKKINRNQIVVEQGQKFEDIIIIRKGSFQVIYENKFKQKHDSNLNLICFLNDYEEGFNVNRRKELKGIEKCSQKYKVCSSK
jgi:CRP-like cAMP-binding protein